MKGPNITELQELTSLEGQLVDALQRMAKAASHSSLKNALKHHREQTQAQKQRLESILKKHGANSRAHTDQAMQALINETEKMIAMVKGDDLRDDQRLLHESLEEEKEADAELTKLAKSEVNQAAVQCS